MDGSDSKRLLALAFCLALLVSGCQGGGLWTKMFGKASDTVPGIMSPPERIAAIKKMSQEAAGKGLEAQEQLAQKYAGLYPRENDPLIRAELVRAVRSFSCPTAASLIREAVRDKDADVRVIACQSLRRQSGPETTAALAEVLGSDTDLDVRLAAAEALGDRRDPAAVSALGAALDERDPAMQYRAVASLRKIAPQDLGNDVERWRQYVKGQPLSPPKSESLVERIRSVF